MNCPLCLNTGRIQLDEMAYGPCPNGCDERLQKEWEAQRNAAFKAKHGREMDYEDVLRSWGATFEGESLVMPHQRNGKTVLLGE